MKPLNYPSQGLICLLLALQWPGANAGDFAIAQIPSYFTDGYATGKAAWHYNQLKHGDTHALANLVEMAKGNNYQAQNIIGVALDQGLYGVKRDSTKAARYFAAAMKDEPLAAYNLGLLQILGRGVSRDEAAGVESMKRAVANIQLPQAYVRIGLYCYRNGRREEAERWLLAAARAGDPVGAYYVGRMIVERKGNYQEALNWLEISAGFRNVDAAALIRHVYTHGLGIERSPEMATGWELIRRVLERHGQAADLPMDVVDGQSESVMDTARAFARRWLTSHPGKEPPNYTSTLVETAARPVI